MRPNPQHDHCTGGLNLNAGGDLQGVLSLKELRCRMLCSKHMYCTEYSLIFESVDEYNLLHNKRHTEWQNHYRKRE